MLTKFETTREIKVHAKSRGLGQYRTYLIYRMFEVFVIEDSNARNMVNVLSGSLITPPIRTRRTPPVTRHTLTLLPDGEYTV